MKMEQTKCSETSAYKLQTPVNHPEESIRHSEQGESLKSRIPKICSNLEISTTKVVQQPLSVIGFESHVLKALTLQVITHIYHELFNIRSINDTADMIIAGLNP
jgi:hypothetical protein